MVSVYAFKWLCQHGTFSSYSPSGSSGSCRLCQSPLAGKKCVKIDEPSGRIRYVVHQSCLSSETRRLLPFHPRTAKTIEDKLNGLKVQKERSYLHK